MNAYLIAGLRSAVTKAPKGGFRFTRPDDLAAEVIRQVLATMPQLDPHRIDELIVGNAVPEAEQGMQMGRIVSLLALPKEVPGMVVNRYCGSGLESIAIAAQRIHCGMADLILAGGTESMSMVPVMGWKTALNYTIASTHGDYYTSMGLTAEMVAREYQISRDDQDAFALASHTKAMAALDNGRFKAQIAPVVVEEVYVDERMKKNKKEATPLIPMKDPAGILRWRPWANSNQSLPKGVPSPPGIHPKPPMEPLLSWSLPKKWCVNWE